MLTSAGEKKGNGEEGRKRILIVDDHPLIRLGLKELLSIEPGLEVCDDVEDIPSALHAASVHHPDIAIIDIALKPGDGLDLIRQLKSQDAQLRMLVYSMHEDSLYAERALKAGAKGYLNKREDARIVILAIRRVLENKIYLSDFMMERILKRISDDEAPVLSSVEKLSPRELQVLNFIGQALSSREIAERLNLSPKTIETYRLHIREKLGLKTRNEEIQYAVLWVRENV